MSSSQRFQIEEESQVGGVRRVLVDMARRLGLDETETGKLAIVITELGCNLIRHAGGGEIILREIGAGIEILAIDRGPGIGNLGEALRDGYSTHGTPGTGLGAVRRLSARFDVFSQPGKGTVVACACGGLSPGERFETGAVSVAVKGETVCGDNWASDQDNSRLRILVADGLGHGPYAAEASREAVAVFAERKDASPAETLEMAHHAMTKTRGAAGAMVVVHPDQHEVVSAGVGNISMRLLLADSAKSLVSDNGTLGANVRRIRNSTQAYETGALVVLYSDGLGTHWSLADYPGAAARHPSILAALLYRDHQRERDDVTVVVSRERP